MTREELITRIEETRRKLNQSIDQREKYEVIYRHSVELDGLIEQYIVSGFYNERDMECFFLKKSLPFPNQCTRIELQVVESGLKW